MGDEAYIESLLVSDPLRVPTLREMVGALELPAGSRGLDVGCGIGLQCVLLAGVVGANGHVTGLDISADMLQRGGEMVEEAGLSGRVSFQEGDVRQLPFEDNSFDWAWSADCVGYAPMEPLPLLREMVRVVKPGGIIAVAAWASENLLPGYPGLEARLKATSVGIAPFVQGKNPKLHFLRALGWFRELGLTEARGKAFAGSFSAPLSPEIREALAALFDMRWPNVEAELSAEDKAEFRRLCLPGSPDFILDRPDYYAFFNYAMFWGRKPR
ncbi:MAG: class I SAM-dependent methyltransferase [Dehalococcoidia bacterium]|jgi:demethylmenaquinone methyltransferase/2-methoxy-6-polyprenyl-1,4-benzoquinol methylase